MKETSLEVEDSSIVVGPSTKRKALAIVAETGISLAVTVVAGVITNQLNKKVQAIILPDQES